MKTDEFDFDLPETSIAAYPRAERDESRLMVVDRASGRISEAVFSEIVALLPRRSLIVLNDSRVIPARLHGTRASGGRVELLLIRRILGEAPARDRGDAEEPSEGETAAGELWEAIGRHLGRVVPGDMLRFPGPLSVELLSREGGGLVRLRLRPPPGRTVSGILEEIGEIPIPPYIVEARRRGHDSSDPRDEEERRRNEQAFDRERYQTVYASSPGSVAAPTAGLHFTPGLLERLRAAGHELVTISLHVGLGTFRPVKTETLEEHQMDPEWYSISPAAAASIARARDEKRPIVAVGTTVVRALESGARALPDHRIVGGTSASRLFLSPGAEFHVVTDLITNFHLPRSTLLMLVSAFAGRKNILAAYGVAMARGYRFYSYGDAMFIRGEH